MAESSFLRVGGGISDAPRVSCFAVWTVGSEHKICGRW